MNVVPGISLLAVSVVDCPVHIDVDPEKLMTGAGFTVIVADAIFLHPFDSVAVTTYLIPLLLQGHHLHIAVYFQQGLLAYCWLQLL